MAVEISTALLDQMRAEAKASPAQEICGLLLGAGDTVAEARACRNVAADPARRFEIDPAALLAAHRSARAGGSALLGSYHSHPRGTASPSACDAEAASPDGSLWLILANGEVRGWRAVAGGAVHGRFDPMVLSPV